MKLLIILLLTTTGIEEVKFETNGLNCSEMATAWREVNTTYYDMIEGNPKLQGNYTKEGKLMIGWIC
jgi:hypothetical protein|tara:strand:- start:112 stop:312 length:201 start_codon:yes stop_codon:yes gene_type:complete